MGSKENKGIPGFRLRFEKRKISIAVLTRLRLWGEAVSGMKIPVGGLFGGLGLVSLGNCMIFKASINLLYTSVEAQITAISKKMLPVSRVWFGFIRNANDNQY